MQENKLLSDWLKHRHITDTIIGEFNIYWGINDIMGECIVIPVHDHLGNLSFNKYRRNPMVDTKPKYLYDKGSSIALYGWHKAKDSNTVLITEGEMDALVAWSHNIPAITSTGGAMSFQEEWVDLLKDKEVIICFDNDEAGANGMVKVLKYLPHAYIIFLPDRPGVKDISDYVSNGGDLHKLLKTKIQFKDLQDVIDHRSSRLSLWQSTWFHDNYIKEHTIPEYVKVERKITGVERDRIAIAKTYPITNILNFNKEKKALCPWHKDTTPSLHYYQKTNTVYCFSCGKHGDVIDIYREINKSSFNEAINNLQ